MLDAGALVAIERSVRGVVALLKRELLAGRAGQVDVIDAAVALLAMDGDLILTSDPGDLVALVAASGTYADVVPV